MPKSFRTVRELLYWEYAKLMAGSAVLDRKNYAFVNKAYHDLMTGVLSPSAMLRENKLLVSNAGNCAYCGATGQCEWEHIVPRSAGGPDTIDNLVQACGTCNRAKGARDPYQWYGPDRIDQIPRIVLGKLLKLLLDEYDRIQVLDSEHYMQAHQIVRCTLTSVMPFT